nr:MAG TPA: hypothetical protein [Microviridae sp.]
MQNNDIHQSKRKGSVDKRRCCQLSLFTYFAFKVIRIVLLLNA